MANTAEIKAVITAEDRASGVLKGFSSTVVAKGIIMADIFENLAKKVFDFAESSIKAFSESEDAIAQTNAVLKSTNGIAGVTAKEVDKLSKAFQKTTKFSDEQVRGAENLLLTFTKIGKDTFPDVTGAVLDLSTALHKDLESASIQVGKAMQGNSNSISALRKSGVDFTDEQQKMIESLFASGKAADAQRIILKELNKEFGGSAKAAGDTLSGQLAKLKNNFNNVQESIGQTIVIGLTPLSKRLADFVASDKFQKWLTKLTDWLNLNLPKAMEWLINTGLPKLKELFDALWPIVQKVWDIFTGLIGYLIDNKWVFKGLIVTFAAIKTAMFLEGALSAFKNVMAGVKLAYSAVLLLITSPIAMPAIAIGATLLSIWAVKNAALDALDAIRNMNNSKDTLEESNRTLLKRLQQQTKAPYSSAMQAQARATISKLAAAGQFDALAGGTDFARGGPTLVGERGPEIVNMPRGAQVISNNQLGSTINVNFSGIFTGNQQEFRKLAVDVFKAYDDAKGMGTL